MASFGAARNVHSTPSGGVSIGGGGGTGGGSGGRRGSTGGGLYPRPIKASRANEPTETIITASSDEAERYREALRRAGLLLDSQGGLI
jgi:hypothetical protein